MLEPGSYAGVPVYQLLQAAARGRVAVDHRFLHAVLDDPDKAIPDLVRFAQEDRENDRVDLELELIDIFHYLGSPEALPYLIGLMRQNPNEISDDVVEACVRMGAAAIDPVLSLIEEVGEQDAGDLAFVLAAIHVRDPRILDVLTRRLATEPLDAALCLEVYGDPAAVPALEAALAKDTGNDRGCSESIQAAIRSLSAKPEEADEPPALFDIWSLYPEEKYPDFDYLDDQERLTMLQSASVPLRREVALSFDGTEPSDEVTARLLELATGDPDVRVRGACWEALGKLSDRAELRTAMLGVLSNPVAALEEKSGAAVALARNYEPDRIIVEGIEALYQEPRGRANALKAMGYSLDRRFAELPAKHLDDSDVDVRRQAICCVGYLQLSSEAARLEKLLSEEEYRPDALFAYALSMPGETSPGRARAMLAKVNDVAGGFTEDEEKLVMFALDQRLMLRGKRPVFYPEDLAEESPDSVAAVNTSKPGRNDMCPCGSGSKYKKCCGAQ